MQTYSLEIANLKRELQIMNISDTLATANFVNLGDTELISTCAPLLADKLKDANIDMIITTETNGVPIAYEVSKQLGLKRFVVARKSVKDYMYEVVKFDLKCLEYDDGEFLCIDKSDADAMNGKNIAIINDIVSTGKSLKAIEGLVESVGGIVTARAVLLAEGSAASRGDLISLNRLPLFERVNGKYIAR